jgi:hypothetical protein
LFPIINVMLKKSTAEVGFAHIFLIAAVVGFVALISVANIRIVDHPQKNSNVRGVQLLAKGGEGESSGGGSDHGGGDSGSGSTSGSSGSSGSSGGGSSNSSGQSGGSSNSGSGSSGSSASSGGNFSNSSSNTSVPANSQVECVGPDGKHIQTTFQACSDLNKLWRRDNFSFKVINREGKANLNSKTSFRISTGEARPKSSEKPHIQGLDELRKESELSESSSSGHKQKGKGSNRFKLKVKSDEGENEIELEEEDATGSATKFTEKGTEVETELHLGLDDKTHKLQVTTISGIKTLNILPIKALEIAETEGIQSEISKVELINNSVKTASDGATFKLTGIRKGKLFGLIPLTASVESQIGAQSGDVLEVKQPLWLKLLSSFIK